MGFIFVSLLLGMYVTKYFNHVPGVESLAKYIQSRDPWVLSEPFCEIGVRPYSGRAQPISKPKKWTISPRRGSRIPKMEIFYWLKRTGLTSNRDITPLFLTPQKNFIFCLFGHF